MTNTNESETTPTFDPSKSIFDFLKELLKTPFLYIFSVGVILIAFSMTRNIPGVGKIPNWGTLILLPFGGWLSFISINLYKQENNQNKLIRKHSLIYEALENEKEKSNKLQESIEQAISLLESKENKDSEDIKILGVLQKRTIQILQDINNHPNKIRTSDWVKSRSTKWLKFLKDTNYEFLDSRDKHIRFFHDIEEHLNLLFDNIRNDVYRTPSVEGLTRSIDDSSSYVRAFKDLRTEIRAEMEIDKDILKYEGIDYWNKHIDAFIALIDA